MEPSRLELTYDFEISMEIIIKDPFRQDGSGIESHCLSGLKDGLILDVSNPALNWQCKCIPRSVLLAKLWPAGDLLRG
jgi:hypothetical protein